MDKTPQEKFFEPLQNFAEQLTSKFEAHASGEPEDQLKPPIDTLFSTFGTLIKQNIVLKGESKLENRLGKPDFAVHAQKLPLGYLELKAPGKGANPKLFKGHDLNQWNRFKNVPNLMYSDGNEWALYRNGELQLKRLSLNGDVRTDGKKAVTQKNARDLFNLIAEFVSWVPVIPKKPKALAEFLAPFCCLIREEVLSSIKDINSPIYALKYEVKTLLFPDASDYQFADAYAQTIIFALLLSRLEEANTLDLRDCYGVLEEHHSLLSRTLQVFTDKQAYQEISSSLTMTQRVINEIPIEILKTSSVTDDPWLFFYEDFLAAYDPKLRKEAGVYFTPIEVVNCQVKLIDEILNKHLGKEMGFVEPGVATLDPAAGTGTYLLAIIDYALSRVREEEGPGAVKGGARSLAQNLYGFEWMVGSYSVAQLRFSQALTSYGTSLPATGPGFYLTNTLASPYTEPPAPPLFHKPIAKEQERAIKIKDSEHVLVCIGNPPYGRHGNADANNRSTTGGWIRHGNDSENDFEEPILEDFLKPARDSGLGVHLKNLYNLYVYFIRWAIWKVFEHKTAVGPGIVSFITASSYIDGKAFVGIRKHMRKVCDYIDIIDLGGEGRGAKKEDNVFTIKTPVAIFIAWRKSKPNPNAPAIVRYTNITGKKEEKLKFLEGVVSESCLEWQTVSSDWEAPFLPDLNTSFSTWPKLTNLFPWQQSGAQIKRLWPISPQKEVLEKRWNFLIKSEKKAELFKETRDRKISRSYQDLRDANISLASILNANIEDMITPVRYSYRSFDRQWVFPDARLGDYLRPVLWQAHSEHQIYLTGLLTKPLGLGPALVACAEIPDMDHFSNRGAKDIIPLYRNSDATEPNILFGLLEILESTFHSTVTMEDFSGYVYGILAQSTYTQMFLDELSRREIRVPITKNKELFTAMSVYGKHLIWLHTYGQRLTDKENPKPIPKGEARCITAVSEAEDQYPNNYNYDQKNKILHVGDGSFGPVSTNVFNFEVSGFKVVQSWLGYRMKERSGKKSSKLDDIRPCIWTYDFTRELLELLWVLEHTISGYEKQNELLENILGGDLFTEDELPKVSNENRKAPKLIKPKENSTLF